MCGIIIVEGYIASDTNYLFFWVGGGGDTETITSYSAAIWQEKMTNGILEKGKSLRNSQVGAEKGL